MVSTQRSWDLRELEAWIADDFIPSLRTGPQAGQYARRPGEPETALYGAADVACILYTLDCLEPSPEDADGWIDALSAFQDAPSGFFVDRSGALTTAHNTGFAVGAMNLFCRELRNGKLPRAPLAFVDQIASPADAELFAATLDWRNNCYEAGEILVGHASTFFNVADTVSQTWFHWLVQYIEETKLDSVNGMVGIDKPAAGDGDQIGGTLHFDFLWAALKRTLPHARERAAALLGLQQPNGLWDDANPWWLTFDAIYMLGRTMPELPDDDAAEVRKAIASAVSTLAARALDPTQRAADFVEPWIGAHMVTGAISLFAYAQQLLGPDRVITNRRLKLVLDRRPYI
jgi:hypothetical protein